MLRYIVNSEMPVRVRKEFLGADADVVGFVVAIEFYTGSVPTFTFQSGSGHIFAYLPPNAFSFSSCKPTIQSAVDIECPTSTPSVSVLPITEGGWGRIDQEIVEWKKYVCSIDWEDENLLLHFVILDDDTFCFIRNSRFQIGGTSWNPPKWKKLRDEWHLPNRDVCLIIQRGDLYLGVSRKDDSNAIGLPAGNIDGNESPIEAAARELREETGMLLSSATLIDERFWRGRHISCFLGRANGEPEDNDTLRRRGEGIVGWVTQQALIEGPFGEYNKAIFDEYCIGMERK